MNYEVEITVEYRDEYNYKRYSTKVSVIDDSMVETLKRIVKVINDFQPYTARDRYNITKTFANNFPMYYLRTDQGEKTAQEYYNLNDEDIDFINSLCSEIERGFQSIVLVKIYPEIQKEILLNKGKIQ